MLLKMCIAWWWIVTTSDVFVVASDFAPMAKVVGLEYPKNGAKELLMQTAERQVVCIDPGRPWRWKICQGVG